MEIVILHDHVPIGAPPDQQDNLVQAREIAATLTNMGHRVHAMAVAERLEDTAVALIKANPDVVFNLVESLWGSCQWLHLSAALLDRLGIRFTGSRSKALRVTTHKIEAKQVMEKKGLPTPAWVTLPPAANHIPSSSIYIIKSVHEHASFGLDDGSIIDQADPTKLMLELRLRGHEYGGDWFAETFVDGREFNISLLAGVDGPNVLPPAEILFEGYGDDKVRMVDYQAKWDEESFAYHHTPRCFVFPVADAALLNELKRLSLLCWDIFELRGWARVDFRVDRTGKPWILEINSNPCLAGDAGFMAAAHIAGLSREIVLKHILTDALIDKPSQAFDREDSRLRACG
jgi:D-alanine-D-alanine ligase